MKKLGSILMMIIGIAIILFGIIILANLTPVKEWTEFHDFTKEYGPNIEIIIGAVLGLFGVLLLFLSVKTDK